MAPPASGGVADLPTNIPKGGGGDDKGDDRNILKKFLDNPVVSTVGSFALPQSNIKKFYDFLNFANTMQNIKDSDLVYGTGDRVNFSEGKNMKMASMEENEREFMRLVEELMERGFSQQEAIDEAREEFDRKAIATGGRVGFADGKNMKMASAPDLEDSRNDMANQMFGKDLRLLTEEELEMLEDEIDRLSIKFMAKGGMPTGIMRTNQAGTIERDYRETGGFVPVGIKEKADDVPAMLSKNEFVMTADAVRGMGNGSIEKGAQRLYDQMKKLESRVV